MHALANREQLRQLQREDTEKREREREREREEREERSKREERQERYRGKGELKEMTSAKNEQGSQARGRACTQPSLPFATMKEEQKCGEEGEEKNLGRKRSTITPEGIGSCIPS